MKADVILRLKYFPIMVLGDVMVDEYVQGHVGRISPEAPVPVLTVRERFHRLGGAGNVVQNLAALGASVRLCSAIGTDLEGQWFQDQCDTMRVDTSTLVQDASLKTTVKTRVIAGNQQLLRIDQEDLVPLDPRLEKAVISSISTSTADAKVAILSDYGKGFCTQGVIDALVAQTRRVGIPLLVDPKGADFRRYRGATFLTPNLREASRASQVVINDDESLIRAGRRLLELTGAEGIIVTKGRDGSSLITAKGTQHFPVRAIEIMDVTGAGDTFVAALALALANGLPISEAIPLANLAASISVSRLGAASVSLKDMVAAATQDSMTRKRLERATGLEELAQQRLDGSTIVLLCGSFDLLHSGHLDIIRKANRAGDILVVAVESDESVRRSKSPGRPISNEVDRADLVAAVDYVDYVIVYDSAELPELIRRIRPDVYVIVGDAQGGDHEAQIIMEQIGGRVQYVKMDRLFSTDKLISKITKRSSCQT